MIIRDLAMIVLSFAGFLRFDDHDHVLKLKIGHIKTDQYRQGNDVLISKGNTLACPVSIFRHYVSLSKSVLSPPILHFQTYL